MSLPSLPSFSWPPSAYPPLQDYPASLARIPQRSPGAFTQKRIGQCAERYCSCVAAPQVGRVLHPRRRKSPRPHGHLPDRQRGSLRHVQRRIITSITRRPPKRTSLREDENGGCPGTVGRETTRPGAPRLQKVSRMPSRQHTRRGQKGRNLRELVSQKRRKRCKARASSRGSRLYRASISSGLFL